MAVNSSPRCRSKSGCRHRMLQGPSMVGPSATSLLHFSVLLVEDHCWQTVHDKGQLPACSRPHRLCEEDCTVGGAARPVQGKCSSAGCHAVEHQRPVGSTASCAFAPFIAPSVHLPACRVSHPLWLARSSSARSSLELSARASNILPRTQKATPGS